MSRAIIFTEGSAEWGHGHLHRCIAYARELLSNGWMVEWRVCGDSLAMDLLKDHSSRFGNWYEDNRYLDDTRSFQLAIIDSYYAPLRVYKSISDKVPNCIYIDDEARLVYPKGYIVNSAPNAELLNYSLGLETFLLAGPKYHPLRVEFQSPFYRDFQSEINTLLIMMGGTDIRGLTSTVINLVQLSFPKSKIVAIVPSTPQREKLREFNSNNLFILGNQTAVQIRSQMEQADICISASGQTTFEICRLGLPSIGIVIADNQRHIMAGLSEGGCILNGGRWDDPQIWNNFPSLLETLKSVERRKLLSQAGQALVDGKGCHNVLVRILEEDLVCSNQ